MARVNNILYLNDNMHMTKSPDSEGIRIIYIDNCPELKEVSKIPGLKSIYVNNCHKVEKISKIDGLKDISLQNCKELKQISIIHELDSLSIQGCPYLHTIDCYDRKKIKKYLSILKITQWYKDKKRMKALWRIAEYYTSKKYSPENVLMYVDLNA